MIVYSYIVRLHMYIMITIYNRSAATSVSRIGHSINCYDLVVPAGLPILYPASKCPQMLHRTTKSHEHVL